jgi:progressive ankylosis protein
LDPKPAHSADLANLARRVQLTHLATFALFPDPATLRRTQRSIFLFWLPLAATWLMMAAEGPFLAAVIARLADPTFNLAAHGVAYAFAVLVEAPVIMIMSASTALVTDRDSLNRLRNFTYTLNGAVTAGMLVVLIPPVYHAIMIGLIALPEEVARLSYVALWIFLPWPGAIGYRRFYQGILIRSGKTRLVALGTVVRLTTMATTAIVLYVWFAPPGAYLGAAALAFGVTVEAVVSRVMARKAVDRLLSAAPAVPSAPSAPPLSYSRIWAFYYPLALTSLIGLAVQPMLTFFMGRAASPVESLAVFPVVSALTFIFRAAGLSFQEVSIALMGDRFEHVKELTRFALGLGLAATGGLALVAFTPVSTFWYQTVSGLSPELATFALAPTAVLVPVPFLSVLLAFQRGIAVVAHRTRPIIWATAIEVAGIAIGFPVLGWKLGMVGVTAASVAFLAGRTASNTYMISSSRAALRASAGSAD